MVLPIVCGIETEYGIIVRSPDGAEPTSMSPMTASSILVSAYVDTGLRQRGASTASGTSWDFHDETPSNDARVGDVEHPGTTPSGARPGGAGDISVSTFAPEVEAHLVNTVLSNGSRFYVDHAHPELSTPECRTPREVVRYDAAGDEILRRAMTAANRQLPGRREVVIYKNNSDGKGQSYGCHENYLLARSTPFAHLAAGATPHLVTRQIFCGAGKVGREADGVPASGDVFQISQRADFFEEAIGLETTLKRPVVNTRDEPHADASRYRRFHVIIGDANISEVATLLKVGTTALWLATIDAGLVTDPIRLAAPVSAVRTVSRDLTLREPLELANGSTMTALDIQWEIFRQVDAAASHGILESIGAEAGNEVLQRWHDVLATLERDPMELADTVDWVAKYRLLDAYRQRHGLAWSNPRLAAMDLQYHDLRPERSLAARLGLQRICSDDEVARAVIEPPESTRAWFRGRSLAQFGDAVVSANWDSLVFDVGESALRRVPMMDPVKGTRAHVEALFDGCEDAAELVRRLGA